MLGAKAGEVLQSPLTATHGIFSEAPTMHEALAAAAEGDARWGFGVESVAEPTWQRQPWRHDVLITLEEESESGLARVVQKAHATVAAHRRVVLILATERPWEALRKQTGARELLLLPPGSMPLGDAAGWPDAPSTRRRSDGTAWATHSWRVDRDGTP